MKVLYFADELTQSGAIKSFEEVVNSMHDIYGIETVVCTSGYGELNERLNDKGIENTAVGYGSYMLNSPITWWKIPIKYILGGIKYYSRKKSSFKSVEENVDLSSIDLIHINVNRTDIGVDIASKYHIPVIMHIREFGQDDFKCWSYKRNYIDYLNKKVTRFIAISEAIKKSWVKRGLDEKKVKVVYNGVAYEKIKAQKPESLENSDTLQLVIVGGVIPSKGQLQAIRALALLPEDIKDKVSLDIIGWSSKEYFAIVEGEIKKLGLNNKVNILGAKSDVYDRLQNYHVGLMCSKAEGFGRVTAEYMHAGLGVIASSCGANPELIDNRENGLLYEYNNINMLAGCIAEYYKDRALLKKCAVNGKIGAAERYTSAKNAEEIYRQYKSVLNIK